MERIAGAEREAAWQRGDETVGEGVMERRVQTTRTHESSPALAPAVSILITTAVVTSQRNAAAAAAAIAPRTPHILASPQFRSLPYLCVTDQTSMCHCSSLYNCSMTRHVIISLPAVTLTPRTESWRKSWSLELLSWTEDSLHHWNQQGANPTCSVCNRRRLHGIHCVSSHWTPSHLHLSGCQAAEGCQLCL